MKEKSLKINFIYNFMYQLLAIMVPLITSPYLARVLGAENIGISSWTSSVVFYFGIFITLGIDNYGSREIAYVRYSKERLTRRFWSIYFCQLINFMVVLILYLMYAIFIAKNYRIILIVLVFSIITKGLDIAWFFSGMEEFKVTVVRNTIVKLITLICVFTFVKNENDLWKYVLINSLGSLIGQITLWPNIKRYVDFYIPSTKEIVKHIKPLWILFVPVLAISVFTYMDKYMIGVLSNVTENGYYENADKIISVPKAFITTIGTVMLPRTAHLIATNQKEKGKYYIEVSMLFTMIMSSALAFGMAAVSDVFSVVFWGKSFAECGVLIKWLSPAIIFSVIGSVIRSQYLIPYARDKEYTISLIAGAVINFIINLILIPLLGSLGAVIGTLCSEILLMSIQLFYVRKELPLKKYIKNGWIFLIFGIIMYISINIVKQKLDTSLKSLIVLILFGISIYFVLFIIYIIKTKNNIVKVMKNDILAKIRSGKNSGN